MKLHRSSEAAGALRVESPHLGRHEATAFPSGMVHVRDTADGALVAVDGAALGVLLEASIDARRLAQRKTPRAELVTGEAHPDDELEAAEGLEA